jgi:hypothetical protein
MNKLFFGIGNKTILLITLSSFSSVLARILSKKSHNDENLEMTFYDYRLGMKDFLFNDTNGQKEYS